jgi:hypothetical protein
MDEGADRRLLALLARLDLAPRYLELCRRHPGPAIRCGMPVLNRAARELGRPLRRNEWKAAVGAAEIGVWFRRLSFGHVEAAVIHSLGGAQEFRRLDSTVLELARRAGWDGARQSGPLPAPADEDAAADVLRFVFELADEAAASLDPEGTLPGDTTLPAFDWQPFARDLDIGRPPS